MSLNKKEFDLIFPFDSPRNNQQHIIEEIIEAYEKGYKYVLLNAPTGIGKSCIAYSVAQYFQFKEQQNKTYFLTSQKLLQDQYINDFSERGIGIKNIKGRYNYQCKLNPLLKCDMGVCKTNKNKNFGCNCPYLIARREAYKFPITVMNYTYFLNMARDGGDIQKPRKFMVCDETHNLESELLSYMTVKLSRKDFKEFDIPNDFLQFPDEKLDDKRKFEWLINDAESFLFEQWGNTMRELDMIDEKSSTYRFMTRKASYLDTLCCIIHRLSPQIAGGTPGIVIQNKTFDITFKPLYASKFANSYLFSFCENALMMSATVISKNQFCRDIGLEEKEVYYIECDSPFPKKNRPIYAMNLVKTNYENIEEAKPKILRAVEKILEKNEGKRGIIHTVSYKIAEYIMENTTSKRLIMPKGKSRDKVIKQFMTSKKDDLVLISPSLTEGISLDGELAEFSIICKLPFGNLGDKFIKTRMNLDSNWYNTNTIKTLVQATGRTVRSENDRSKTYILDKAFSWFYRQNEKSFPKWWKESLIIL